MPKRPNHKALAKLGDDRVLSDMAARVFSAGFVWSVIDNKWPGFEEAFLEFSPKRLLFQPAEERMPFYEKCAAGKYSREERDQIVRVVEEFLAVK